MDTVGTAGALRDYERERWEGVTRSLDASARRHEETAVILERLKGQLDGHDARIRVLEGAPVRTRANLNLWLGVAGVVVVLLVCGVGPLWTALLQYAVSHLMR